MLPHFLKSMLESLSARTEALEQRADDQDDAHRREYLFESVGAMFEKANAYLAILQGVGYAGFFAIWDGTREFMSRPQKVWSLGLMGISLVTFICWHVVLNLLLASQQSTIANVARTPPEKFKDAVSRFEKQANGLRARLAQKLLLITCIILAPALAGMAVVLWVAFMQLTTLE